MNPSKEAQRFFLLIPLLCLGCATVPADRRGAQLEEAKRHLMAGEADYDAKDWNRAIRATRG